MNSSRSDKLFTMLFFSPFCLSVTILQRRRSKGFRCKLWNKNKMLISMLTGLFTSLCTTCLQVTFTYWLFNVHIPFVQKLSELINEPANDQSPITHDLWPILHNPWSMILVRFVRDYWENCRRLVIELKKTGDLK